MPRTGRQGGTRLGATLALLALVLLFAPLGRAAEPPRAEIEPFVRAEKLLGRGKLCLGFGEHDKAIESLTRAWALYHDEDVLLWLARAYDGKQDYESALRTYEEYLRFGVFAGERQAVVARMDEIRTQTRFGKELVEVRVEPSDAELYLDDLSPFFRINHPGQVFVPWGEHRWIVRREDHREKIIPFTVERDTPLAFTVRLDRIEFYVTATLTSTPTGAEVAVDGKVVGKTPVTIKVKEGYYTVRMTLDEGEPFEKLIEFTREGDNLVAADLERRRLDKGTAVAETAIAKDEPPPPEPDLEPLPDAEAPPKAAQPKLEEPTIYRVSEPTKAWKISGWSLVGTGAAGVIAGGVFTYLAFAELSDARGWDPVMLGQQDYDARIHETVDSVNQKFLISTIAYAAGGALVATGVTFLLIDRFMPEASPITVMPSVLPQGGGVTLFLDL